jgi:hypothetical protein
MLHSGMFWVRVLVACSVCFGGASAAHAVTLRCAPCTLPLFGASVRVTGTIADEPFAVAIIGHTKTWKLGAIELRDVVVTARSHGDRIDACAAGSVANLRLTACSALPGSLDRLRRLHDADVTWRLVGANVTGHGSAQLGWSPGGDLRIERGHADLAFGPRTLGSVAIGRASASTEIAGNLARFALDVRGHLHVESILASDLSLRGLEVPLDLRIESGRIAPRAAVVASIGEASFVVGGRQLRFDSPGLVVHDGQPFTWSAFAGDEHRLTWTAIAGLPLELGAGSLAIRFADPLVASGHVRALGGELVLAPFSLRSGTATVRVDGVSVARVANLLPGGRIAATGVLDGELVFDHDRSGVRLERAALHARSSGELHVSRVPTAVGDFQYDRLTCEVLPAGHDPEAIISIHGKGIRSRQELELAINVRGVRALAELE